MSEHPNSQSNALLTDPKAVALLLAATLIIMANATISPAIEKLQMQLGDGANTALIAKFLVPAPSLTVLLFAPLAGWATDRYGRYLILMVGTVLFAVFGSIGLILPNLESILASRLALGVAVAMVMTAQTALIGDCFEGAKRNAFVGAQISARNFGGVLFLSLSGYLAHLAPRLPFAIYLLAALLIPIVWIAFRDMKGSAQKGGATIDGTVETRPWKGALYALAALQVLTTIIFFTMPTQTPFYAASLGHDSATMTGNVLALLSLAGGLSALAYGRIKQSLGFAGTYALGYGLMGLGFLILSQTGYAIILTGAVFIGAGFAIVMPNFVALALMLAPQSQRGRAAGLLTSAVFLGQILSPFLTEPQIRWTGFPQTYQVISITLFVMVTVALLTSLGVRRREKRS